MKHATFHATSLEDIAKAFDVRAADAERIASTTKSRAREIESLARANTWLLAANFLRDCNLESKEDEGLQKLAKLK